MVLVVTVPEDHDVAALERDLTAATEVLGLRIHAEVLAPGGEEVAGEPWTLSVYGADRPGIVHQVSSTVGAAGINITDLTTRVVGEDDRPVYVMLLSVTVPVTVDVEAVREALAVVADHLGVECNLHRAESDIL